ncbi:MAG: polyprenyl synthetase family protein [Thermodesulfobacteriota bacterium]
MHIQEAIDLVKDDIKKVNEGFNTYLDSDVFFIKKVGEYIINSGGKRYRPMLLLLSSKLIGYTGERHIPLAAVVEFIHTATLLHDDVVDNANLRRGKASANSVWGDGASILVGDYLLAKSFSLAVEDGDQRILETLSKTTTQMAEGEVMQLLKHSDPETTEEEYLAVVTNKTAILLSAACKIPALLNNSTDEEIRAMSEYGLNLGIAYQLTDDCLDYTSSNEDLGKAIGNDLREGKVTMPLIKAFRDADVGERELIKRVVEADELKEDDLKKVFDIIEKYEGIQYTLESAMACIENAKEALEIFEPNIERAALMAVADNVIDRRS